MKIPHICIMPENTIEKTIEEEFNTRFLGCPATPETCRKIEAYVEALLQKMILNGYVVPSYKTIKAVINEEDPSKIDITFI